MHARGPLIAKAKLVDSEEWKEPLRDGTLKHRRFIWATQFGVGSTGSGGDKQSLASLLAERNLAAVHARNTENRERKRQPPRVIWSEPEAGKW